MKDFWDYGNQDDSTGDASPNRMRLASLFFPFKEEESSTISTLGPLKQDPASSVYNRQQQAHFHLLLPDSLSPKAATSWYNFEFFHGMN